MEFCFFAIKMQLSRAGFRKIDCAQTRFEFEGQFNLCSIDQAGHFRATLSERFSSQKAGLALASFGVVSSGDRE